MAVWFVLSLLLCVVSGFRRGVIDDNCTKEKPVYAKPIDGGSLGCYGKFELINHFEPYQKIEFTNIFYQKWVHITHITKALEFVGDQWVETTYRIFQHNLIILPTPGSLLYFEDRYDRHLFFKVFGEYSRPTQSTVTTSSTSRFTKESTLQYTTPTQTMGTTVLTSRFSEKSTLQYSTPIQTTITTSTSRFSEKSTLQYSTAPTRTTVITTKESTLQYSTPTQTMVPTVSTSRFSEKSTFQYSTPIQTTVTTLTSRFSEISTLQYSTAPTRTTVTTTSDKKVKWYWFLLLLIPLLIVVCLV